jgi:hypothetical protein
MSEIWAIATYDNRENDERWLINYQIFRKNLGIPIVAVDYGGDCPLEPENAERIIKADGELAWRALRGMAWDALPPECQIVVEIQPFVLFQDPLWYANIPDEFLAHSEVIPYSRVHWLKADDLCFDSSAESNVLSECPETRPTPREWLARNLARAYRRSEGWLLIGARHCGNYRPPPPGHLDQPISCLWFESRDTKHLWAHWRR